MKLLFPILSLIAMVTPLHSDRFQKNDFMILTGSQWKGKLTYLDYGSNKRTTIPANLTVTVSEKDRNTFYFYQEYPKEPHANSTDTVTISKDGKMLGDETFVKREKIGTMIRMLTEKKYGSGEDLKEFRYTYLISTNLFSIKKEEKGQKDSVFFVRNIYEYQRK
jgi:hypothetical protein